MHIQGESQFTPEFGWLTKQKLQKLQQPSEL